MTFDPMTGEPIADNREEMTFDPMTGEPIKKQETPVQQPVAETGGFDPMTGEPIEPIKKQISLQKPVAETGGFDPMTGEPIGQKQAAPAQETGGFDPMTGEPIGQKQAAPVQKTGGFDPMTGEPIGQKQAAPVQEAGGFDPMTGQPIQGASNQKASSQQSSDKKNRKSIKIKPPIIIGAAAAVLAVVLVIVAVSSGLFLGKAGKVMMACANTFKDRPHFVEAAQDAFSIVAQNKYTISFSGEVDNMDLSGEFRNGGKEKQVYAKIDEGGSKLEVTAGIDSKSAKLQVPQLSNYVFVYDYNKNSTGYLVDEMGDDEIEQMNSMLKSLVEETNAGEFYADLFKIFKDELKSVPFETADAEEFTVDDKDVNCKGYTAVITSSNMIHIADKLEKLVNDKYVSLFEAAYVSNSMSGGYSGDWEEDSAELFDDMRDDLEDMEDIELTFYLYKNKLAAIVLSVPEEDAEIELCFEGGDYRMQNMTLKMDDERYRLTGSDTGSKEQFTLEVRRGSSKREIGELEYNYENGKYTVTLDGVTISGKLTSSSSEVVLKVSEVGASYFSVSPDLNIALRKGAKMEKFSGKEFDLGKADEDDYMELFEDIRDKIYDKDLDWIMYLL